MPSPDAAAIAFDFVQNAIGQIIAMVATIIAAARWIDKKNQEKVDKVKREVMEEVNDKEARWKAVFDSIRRDFDSIRRDIRNVKLQEETIRGYIERDIARIDRNVERLSSRTGVTSDSGDGERSYTNPNARSRYIGIGSKRGDDDNDNDDDNNNSSSNNNTIQ